MSINSFTPPFVVSGSNDFKDALGVIHDELHKISKNITYLDAYNITSVVDDSSNFGAQVSSLSNNSALVINSQPFFYNNVSYNTGDIVLKISSGDIVHIKAQPGGIFYPSKITKDQKGNYSIRYTYSKTSPITGTLESANIDQVAKLGASIEFKGLEASDSLQSYVYGNWCSLKDNNISIYKYDGVDIQPQIQFWLVSIDKDNIVTPVEELCVEYTLTQTEDKTKWSIAVDSSLNNLIESNLIWIKVK